MKTLRLFGVALLTVLMSVSFSACGSDDDGNQPSSNPLVGTWEMTDVDGDYYTLELKADGSYYQVEYEGTTEEIDRSYKGSYKILSVNGNTYEVSIFIKERYRKRKGNETVNETQTGFLTLSDNNNTMAVSGSTKHKLVSSLSLIITIQWLFLDQVTFGKGKSNILRYG